MSEWKMLELSTELLIAKDEFQQSYTKLMEVVTGIQNTLIGNEAVETKETDTTVQNRLDTTLNNQKLVSQFRDQLNKPVGVMEPTDEEVNESYEAEEVTASLTEQFRSQLEAVEVEEASPVNLAEHFRSQLDEQEGTSEPYPEEDYEDEEEDYNDDTEEAEETTSSSLAQVLRAQMDASVFNTNELPDVDGDSMPFPAPTPASPNLADVLREQMEEPSLTEQLRNQMEAPIVQEPKSAVVAQASSLSMQEMIQQLRNDITNTSDTADKTKEEELVVAAAASQGTDVTASLRQQLLTQELKKQLK